MGRDVQKKNWCGQVVARVRTEAGISQEKLAIICQRQGWDVGRDIIARIELGLRIVKDTELPRLAKALKIPARKLLPRDGD